MHTRTHTRTRAFSQKNKRRINMIDWWIGDTPVNFHAPQEGIWTGYRSTKKEGDPVVASICVTTSMLEKWSRTCAATSALTTGIKLAPVVSEWLVTGDPATQERARMSLNSVGLHWGLPKNSTKWAALNAVYHACRKPKRYNGHGTEISYAETVCSYTRDACPDLDTDRLLLYVVWEEHGKRIPKHTDRVELWRELRFIGEYDAAEAVLPEILRGNQ